MILWIKINRNLKVYFTRPHDEKISFYSLYSPFFSSLNKFWFSNQSTVFKPRTPAYQDVILD